MITHADAVGLGVPLAKVNADARSALGAEELALGLCVELHISISDGALSSVLPSCIRSDRSTWAPPQASCAVGPWWASAAARLTSYTEHRSLEPLCHVTSSYRGSNDKTNR